MKIKPILYYKNIEKDKSLIYNQNRNKSGIYCWNNVITGKFYIGSAVNLTQRLKKYFSTKILIKSLLKSRSLINSSLLKYGYKNFELQIIEYCDKTSVIDREQYYIDLYQPEYNICKKAGSSIGRKHSPTTILKLKSYKPSDETLAKLIGRKHSPETLLKLKNRKWSKETMIKFKLATIGRKVSSDTILKLKLKSKRFNTKVTNINNNTIEIYSSIRDTAKALGFSDTTIRNYINTDKLLKNTYLITSNRSSTTHKPG